jgi:hypothetical protein
MLSQKDFIEMAESISKMEEDETKERLTNLMVKLFSASNPRFKEDVFREACSP